MAMSNPLSPVLSNLYMEFFERDILSTIIPPNIHWFRYVDDVLSLWPCHLVYGEFLLQLNSLVPSISFTIAIETHCNLPFLDILINRHNHDFKYKIYRKPTNILLYVHYYSQTLTKVKISVFSSMF